MSYKLTGKVATGKRIGRKLGFPTANIKPDCACDLPKNGVYMARIRIRGEEKPLVCVLNQGVHPTLPAGEPTIEAYIPNFDRDIYGKTVEVEYLDFLRPEMKFDSVDALIAQMKRDVENALRINGNA